MCAPGNVFSSGLDVEEPEEAETRSPEPTAATSSMSTPTPVRPRNAADTVTPVPRRFNPLDRPISPDNPFSNLLDPVTRENMLAALLPIVGMVPGPEQGHSDEGEDFSDDDDEEMPDLIPVPRPTLRPLAAANFAAAQDDEELPELVNEPPQSVRSTFIASQQSAARLPLMESVTRLLPSDFQNQAPYTIFGPEGDGRGFGPMPSNDILGVVAAALSYPNAQPTTTPLAPPPPRGPPRNVLPFPVFPRSHMVPLDEDDDLPDLVETFSRAGAAHHESDDELPDLIATDGPTSRSHPGHPSIDDID